MDNEIKSCVVVNSTSDISEFDVMCAIFGLSFPDSATEFQKASLLLAHLMSSVREIVLRGGNVPFGLCTLIHALGGLIEINADEQTCVDIPIPDNK